MVRLLRHLFMPPWLAKRYFPRKAMAEIERAIGTSERLHQGEIRFAVEAALDISELWRGRTAHERALELFSQLRIWDTEHNSGVLIYLLLADRDVEIVADRGINGRVGEAEWERICGAMERAFRQGQFEQGVLTGIREITQLLVKYFPADGVNPDELPDRPLVL